MRQIIILVLLMICTNIYGQHQPIMGKEIGILELGDVQLTDQIILLNKDETEWMRFDFNYEKKINQEGKQSYSFNDIKTLYHWNDSLKPYALHLDYFLLMFKCLGLEENKYKVVVDEETGLEKYIKKDKLFVLRNWQDHIINSVATISYDSETNPMRLNPNDESTLLKLTESDEDFFDPVEIKNDWVKIKYLENNIEKYGWIKWKINHQIIITLFYLI